MIDVGGGFRAIYGAGVMDRMLEDGISVDHCYGVSAGSEADDLASEYRYRGSCCNGASAGAAEGDEFDLVRPPYGRKVKAMSHN